MVRETSIKVRKQAYYLVNIEKYNILILPNAKYMVSSPFASVRGIFWVQLPLEGAPMRVLHPIRGEATPLNL